jgi:hypothetical protein
MVKQSIEKMSRKEHVCGGTYCDVCKDFFAEGHKCYMMPEDVEYTEEMSVEEKIIREVENASKFIFFDFECMQDNLVQCEMGNTPDIYGTCTKCLKSNCGNYEHKPNLCIAQKVCTLCMDANNLCDTCGVREHVFQGDNTVDTFCQWLFSEENYDTTILCHNFQGYDSYPILQYLYKQGVLPTVVPNGAKAMSLTVPACKIKMLDSLNFLPMALAKLPSIFGFKRIEEGIFPAFIQQTRKSIDCTERTA